MALERRRVHYDGRVQGVGFRFTAARLAPGFGVSGSVRNLPDGRVELVAQGDPEKVRAYLDAVRTAIGTKIQQAAEELLPTNPDQSADAFDIIA